MFFKILMRNNEGGNEKQEIYLVWPKDEPYNLIKKKNFAYVIKILLLNPSFKERAKCMLVSLINHVLIRILYLK